MHHRNDEKRIRLDAVQKAVREATDQTAAEAIRKSVTDLGMSSNPSCSIADLGYKFQTETLGLSLVELSGCDKLGFGVRMEADAFHRSADRALRKTVSADLLFTVPERSSSSRRSASSPQSFSASGSV